MVNPTLYNPFGIDASPNDQAHVPMVAKQSTGAAKKTGELQTQYSKELCRADYVKLVSFGFDIHGGVGTSTQTFIGKPA